MTEQEAVGKLLQGATEPGRKVEVTDISDTDMETGMKRMKKGRAHDIDEMRVEMVMAAGDSGIIWTKRLLNARENGSGIY